jgi:hypothetical protein
MAAATLNTADAEKLNKLKSAVDGLNQIRYSFHSNVAFTGGLECGVSIIHLL